MKVGYIFATLQHVSEISTAMSFETIFKMTLAVVGNPPMKNKRKEEHLPQPKY